jgi:hypothetical protein
MAIDKKPPEAGQMLDASLLWRASLWGGAAILALAMTVLITMTDVGTQQLRTIFAGDPPTTLVTQADFVPRAEAEAQRRETLRLETQVSQLIADRERLNARIASLEQNLSDMTGSIKRELAVVAAATEPAPAVRTPPHLEPVDRTDAIHKSDARSDPKVDARGDAETAPKAESRVATAEPAAADERAPPANASPQAAPPLGEPIRLPPMRIASTTGDPTGKEIGIDLGGARSMDIMHARWAAVKANFGPLLQGLYPVVARETRAGMIPYRLIVGPLPNAAAAAQICARFAASKVTCRSTKFAGEQLTMP